MRRLLWGAFTALVILVLIVVVLNLAVLSVGRRQESDIVQASAPLLDAVQDMDSSTTMLVSSARGYTLTRETQFLQRYDEGIRQFGKASALATQLANDPRDVKLVGDFRKHFVEVRDRTDKEIQYSTERSPQAIEPMMEAARLRRVAPDYAGLLLQRHRRIQAQQLESMTMLRQWLIIAIILASMAIIIGAAIALSRIERSLNGSIARQVKRTETMIAGMTDGVMLIDAEGKTVFINPAGQKLIGSNEVGVPIYKHSELYGFRGTDGAQMDARELPAARALSVGRPVNDAGMLIDRGDQKIAISMSATPLREDGKTVAVVITFRDITERRRLEDEMAQQANRAQIVAEAGAFFASNIDPVWVTQAIAERSAEVLGDWAAVILQTGEKELKVAAIHHRDIASLGLAWSYIYRQPLIAGEGIIGQVISTGYPSLTSSFGAQQRGEAFRVGAATTATPMQVASLLTLPLRTRRGMLGALVIAANDQERAMTDETLALAEVLAERAALALENAKLYTEQVEARRKVEDLSRLKDEFLSIASHELRTPVTSIKGYTQLAKTLIREGDLETSEEYLEIALDQIDRMSRLILELLDVSRIETGRLDIRRDAIDWSTFVKDVVQRHHTAISTRHFHINIPDASQQIVNGDRDRLEQVLGNLIENSVKYSPDGSDIFVNVEEKGEQILTSVRDRGLGIPGDELAQVFERFHRGRQVSSTNYGGLGLGLYITKQIVERHGGSIWVESTEGEGTTFFFSLPTAPATAASPAPPEPQGTARS